jgi:hypothetical protein
VLEMHRLDDWHRVERALARFRREIEVLKNQGWRESPVLAS